MKYLVVYFLLIPFAVVSQNNLLDTSTWTVGNGSVTGFPMYGSTTESIRELDMDPFGNQSVIWKGIPQTPSSSGGWLSDTFPIDHTQTYRFTVWMKKQNAFTGSEVFGTEAYDSGGNDTARSLEGNISANPIFEAGNVPSLDKWYLYVGFLHNSSYTGTTSIGGVYDPVTGNKVLDAKDFKFSTNSITAKHRAYYWSGENAADILQFFDPTVYIVNGQEPTIAELLNPTNIISVTSVSVAPSTLNLNIGDSSSLVAILNPSDATDQNVSWLSSNTSVATVNSSGLVTAVSGGTTDVTVTTNDGGFTAQSTVTVSDSSGGGNPPPSGDSLWTKTGSTVSLISSTDLIALGTTNIPNGFKMAIDGKLITEEVRVELSGDWPDYVFSKGYNLPSLEEIQKHIEEKGHLPNIPSAKEVHASGIALGEMNRLLLEKIEELTLHVIELKSEINELKSN